MEFSLQEVLDGFGCDFKCSAISDVSQENQFVIARPDVSVLFPRNFKHNHHSYICYMFLLNCIWILLDSKCMFSVLFYSFWSSQLNLQVKL